MIPPARLSAFAVAAPGLEALVTAELAGLGINARQVAGGAEWEGGIEEVRSANLQLRIASRVLVRIAEFRARTFFELERHASRIEWSRWLRHKNPITLRVNSKKSKLYHEGAIAERLARAVALQTKSAVAEPNDEEHEGEAAQLFVVRVLRDQFTISIDASGALLHRRGYRQEIARAPLRETLAAALLHAASWRGERALLDPFCGSGTIPIEAALIARRIAPGLASADRSPRRFAFEQWPDHDAKAWSKQVEAARQQILPAAEVVIAASDRNTGATQAARANAARAGVEQDIDVRVAALSAAAAPAQQGLLVTNPPYGKRVSEGAELRDLYAALGRIARERIPEWSVALVSADPILAAQTRLPFRPMARTRNGGLPVEFLLADLAAIE